MPQLDLSTYIPQIFWFSLCFAMLYGFVSRIILPRIATILEQRKNVIDADLSLAAELDSQICDIQIKTENLKKEASQNYRSKLDQATKDAARQREKTIEELKEKIDQTAKNSRLELQNFVAKAQTQNEIIVKNLVQKMAEKFFGQTLATNFSKE